MKRVFSILVASLSLGGVTLAHAGLFDPVANIDIHTNAEPGDEIRGQATEVAATDYVYAGTAILCTNTCDQFASLGGPGAAVNPTPSQLDGTVAITAAPGDVFGFADVDPDITFEIFNSGAPIEAAIFAPDADSRCDGLNPGTICNATTANPLPLNSAVVELRESVPTQGTATGGTLNANGGLASGLLLFEFVAPPLSTNGAWLIVNLGTGATQVCLFYSVAGCVGQATEIAVFAGAWCQAGVAADRDCDGVTDDVDNCLTFANPGQADTNGDGFGNACDADLDGNCSVGFEDLNAFKAAFPPNPFNADADFNDNGFIDFGDLARLKQTFFNGAQPGPGPSAQPNACDGT